MIKNIIRPYLLALKPYSSARDEYSGKEGVFLDANENPYNSVAGSHLNRYPDPYQHEIKSKLAVIKGVFPEQIFLGNGSDEAIDLLIKSTCEPGKDNILILPPTYGMYQVCADIQQIEVRKCNLTADFQLDIAGIAQEVDANTKLIFVCSPNNPSGNLINILDVQALIDQYPDKLIVIDEAYIDFAEQPSFLTKLNLHENIVVLQTFSKAWGMAGLRVGMAFADAELIKIINKIKYPYNLNLISQNIVLKALDNEDKKNKYVKRILKERFKLFKELLTLDIVRHIYPSDSNQLLVKFYDAKAVFEFLLTQKVIVRDRTNVILCEDCLRISIGTSLENEVLMEKLRLFKK